MPPRHGEEAGRVAVIDTNVVVSGMLSPSGPPGRIMDLAVGGIISIAYDDRVLDEYRRVCARPRFSFEQHLVDAILDSLAATGTPVVARPLAIQLPDDKDLPFLEVAISAGVPLVTGNARHYVPRFGRLPIPVLSPREYVDRLRRQSTT